MKTFEFDVNNKRNVEREELFILTIVERVLAGFLSSISFIDQAQFCDLLQKRQKNKQFIQPLHLQILGSVKKNLVKNQTPMKEPQINYEIRTIASSSIDMRKGYIHSFSNRNLNNKEQQTTEQEGQFIAQNNTNRSKHMMLDRTYNSGAIHEYSNRSQQQNQKSKINPFQLLSPNSTQLETSNNTKDYQTLHFQKDSDNFSKINEKAFINIVSQDGQIEQAEDYIISNKQSITKKESLQNRESFTNKDHEQKIERKTTENDSLNIKQNQPYLDQQLQQQNGSLSVPIKQNGQESKQETVVHQEQQSIFSRKQSQNFPMGSDSSKMDLKEKLQKYYSNDEEFSSRKPMSSSERVRQITQTYTELARIENGTEKGAHIQSAQNLDSSILQKESRRNKSNQQVKFVYSHGKTEEMDATNNQTNFQHYNSPKKSLEIEHPTANFLSPPASSRTLKSAKSTKTKLKTFQSNDIQKNQQEIIEDQVNQNNSNSKDESQISILDQSLHQKEKSHPNLRPSTTKVELTKENDYQQFQTHDNLDQLKKQNSNLLYQTSLTSIMHDEENFGNNHQISQQINIQVRQCDPIQTNTNNNVIVEESVEGSPNYKPLTYHPQGSQFSLLKLEDQKSISAFKSNYERQQYSPTSHNLPVSGFLPQQSLNNLSINQSQSQQKMLIPINNTSASNKNNRSSNKSKSQIKELSGLQKNSEDSQPESKLTIESSQGEKSNRSKVIRNPKQLKLPAAAVGLNFARRKSSNQISPMDPKKMEQQEKEKQRQIEYQKQLDKMKYERELMEQYRIPDNMPLHQKKAIIEQLINQLEINSDQDVKYQIMLYKQRQEQIGNSVKQELQYNSNINTCYEELLHIQEQKLKHLGKEDPSKVQFLKFEDQLNTNFPGQSKQFSQDPESPLKRNFKFLSKLDPVEIERQMNRINEFKQETEMLKFFSSFNSQYDKEVDQCDLDYPTLKDRFSSVDYSRGLLPKVTYRRRKGKKKSTKIVISSYRMDPKKLEKVLCKAEKIKQVGMFLL